MIHLYVRNEDFINKTEYEPDSISLWDCLNQVYWQFERRGSFNSHLSTQSNYSKSCNAYICLIKLLYNTYNSRPIYIVI